MSKDQKDYYVKWESLPYSEATWEVVTLIERKWPQKIKEFKEREESKKTPSKMTKALRSRPKFVKINEQPEFIGGNEVIFLLFVTFDFGTLNFAMNKSLF